MGMETIESRQRIAVQLTWLARRELPDVLRIEEDVCSDSTPNLAWGEEDFLLLLRETNVIGNIAVDRDGNVLGFVIYEIKPTHLILLNFAVCPDVHRSGVGSQIISRMKSKLSNQRREVILCDVRESNLRAQQFLKSQGFRCNYVHSKFFKDTGEDAYSFEFGIDRLCQR